MLLDVLGMIRAGDAGAIGRMVKLLSRMRDDGKTGDIEIFHDLAVLNRYRDMAQAMEATQ
jgi:hypothetical protein